MTTLLLELSIQKNDFCIHASADEEKELVLTDQAHDILACFKTVYDILQKKDRVEVVEFERAIGSLSDRLLTPFLSQLRKCDLVRFVVCKDLVRCAFDLLLFDASYLFLQRSVCYQIDEGIGEDRPVIELESALLIADLTADPEKACQEVSRLIPKSKYAEVQNASLGMVKEAAGRVDALVISAHGDIDEDNEGALHLNGETLSAEWIGKLAARLVYFDSCKQGVNMAYLQALQDESDVWYYLAPIISNDAGDSSTKTMVWFFTALMKHKDPIRSLCETRKRLYKHYRGQEGLDLVTSLNKAFAFRLYEFVSTAKNEKS